jgi:hypothetical protein
VERRWRFREANIIALIEELTGSVIGKNKG